jgi:6-phosphogluconate dehydrogenase
MNNGSYKMGIVGLGAMGSNLALNIRGPAQPVSIARIWRGGCIIRSQLLESICSAYHEQPDLMNPLLDPTLGQQVLPRQEDLRSIVCTTVNCGISVPGLMLSFAYFDACRSLRLPVNLIQAQRVIPLAYTPMNGLARRGFSTPPKK